MSSPSPKPAASASKKRKQFQNEDHNNEMKPLGHAPPRTGLAYRMAKQQPGTNTNELASSTTDNNVPVSLVSLQEACRHAIVANLERFPPESMRILDSEEWNHILTCRHSWTQPKMGTGGLDGTGRKAPALSDKFLGAVEEAHQDEKVRESEIADTLLWKDCVNFRFPLRSHLSRPKVLEFPWPLWIEQIQTAGAALLEPPPLVSPRAKSEPTECETDGEAAEAAASSEENMEAASATTYSATMEESLQILEASPMNVNLLMASSIGKTLKKALKKLQKQESSSGVHCQRMQTLLDSWKSMAQREGVVDTKPPPSKKKKLNSVDNEESGDQYAKEDWDRVESCHTWRQLFAALKAREDQRRSNQGAKMRQIRKDLNSSRPKVVKVRPAGYSKAKHERILHHATMSPSASASPSSRKMAQLKREVQVTTSRVNRGEAANTARLRQQAASCAKSGFALAVAGAAGERNKAKRQPKTARNHMPVVQKSARNKTNLLSKRRK